MKISFTIDHKQFESVIPFVRKLPDETYDKMESVFRATAIERGIKIPPDDLYFPTKEECIEWSKARSDSKKVGFEYAIPEVGIVLQDVTTVNSVDYEYSPTFVFHNDIPRPEWIKITLTYDKANKQ